MIYPNMKKGIFLARPNRFLAEIEMDGKKEVCHVKNTGRCRELLQPGVRVLVQKSDNPNRKTAYDLIAVYKGDILVNIDSQIPNAAVEEWIRKGNLFEHLQVLKREVRYGDSRFDLYAEYGEKDSVKKAFLEVKGCTLETDGVAAFPDAPTERGVKHVEELCRCLEDGYEGYLIFLIQMKGVHKMVPNWKTHEAFGQTLQRAAAAGVHILAYDSVVTENSIRMDQPVFVDLTDRA